MAIATWLPHAERRDGHRLSGARTPRAGCTSRCPRDCPSITLRGNNGGSGWVEVDYGVGGNVEAMTVHGQCGDVKAGSCADSPTSSLDSRRINLRAGCACAVEQHYVYRWDELNRLAEARRYDRSGGGSWTLAVRQRYRYDAANVRTVKQTLDQSSCGGANPSCERIALYVYAGDFERRGLVRDDLVSPQYVSDSVLGTETQYVIAGARTVWQHDPTDWSYDRDARLTVGLTDLIQTTAAVLDVRTGALLEASTYYPNGARETYLVDSGTATAPEVAGFTGKEGDEEVGLVYFGARYLVGHIGRWATPDPLHIHMGGGGEPLNSFHYLGGTLLASRDAAGLEKYQAPDGQWFDIEAVRRGPDGNAMEEVWTPIEAPADRVEARNSTQAPRSRASIDAAPGDSGVRLDPVVPRAHYGSNIARELAGAGYLRLAEIAEAGHGCAYCHLATRRRTLAEADADIDLAQYDATAGVMVALRDAAIIEVITAGTGAAVITPPPSVAGLLRGPASGPRVISPPGPGQVLLGGRDNAAAALLLEGHGYTAPGEGFVLPSGTYLRMAEAAELGEEEAQAAAIAGNFGDAPAVLLGPGDPVPNLVLLPPTADTTVRFQSTIVNRATFLRDIIEPDMGLCIWLACR